MYQSIYANLRTVFRGVYMQLGTVGDLDPSRPPNRCMLGGGKTTQVKILAGDLEPTAGEVIKSSKDLRVAFLRQEFVDELVMERSLKEELISVFTEEAAVLAALQECEVRDTICRVVGKARSPSGKNVGGRSLFQGEPLLLVASLEVALFLRNSEVLTPHSFDVRT